MSGSAWIMLIVTWAVVVFFAGRFLWKVLRSPEEREE